MTKQTEQGRNTSIKLRLCVCVGGGCLNEQNVKYTYQNLNEIAARMRAEEKIKTQRDTKSPAPWGGETEGDTNSKSEHHSL